MGEVFKKGDVVEFSDRVVSEHIGSCFDLDLVNHCIKDWVDNLNGLSIKTRYVEEGLFILFYVNDV